MPTGYTAGLVDGTITDFEGFATTCMRAFGATVHMREDSLDTEYEPRIPSDHHLKGIETAKQELKRIKALTDDEIRSATAQSIKVDIEYNEVKISQKKELLAHLNSVLKKVNEWTPPTEEHESFKEFMQEQIQSTINHDADFKYNTEQTEMLKNRVGEAPEIAREKMMESAQWNLDYHTKEQASEVKHCATSNKWVEDLMNSFNVGKKSS